MFVDTGAFVALRNRSEREHEAARGALSMLLAERTLLLTSNYVFAETYTALLVRVGREGRRSGGAVAFEPERQSNWRGSRTRFEEQAWAILESHADKSWSYVDATSFALMERERITEAFAFDHHFAQRGLTLVPSG